MAVNTYNKILLAGTQAQYDALASKDANKLYFCTDTGKLYKGSVDFTNALVVSTNVPTSGIIQGKIYHITSDGTFRKYNGATWDIISYPLTTTVDDQSDDVHVPSAAAVYSAIEDAVEGIITGGDVVKEVEAKSTTTSGQTVYTPATLTITKGDDSTEDVLVRGVALAPTYQSSDRTFTFPVSGGDPVVVTLGKDEFIDPTADNRYDPTDESIHLYLNDGTGEPGTTGTEIVIPVKDLIDTYQGGTSTTASAAVTSTTDEQGHVIKTITPSVRLADEQGLTNAIQIHQNGGIYVDLSDYALTSDVTTAISGVQDQIDSLAGRMTTAEGAITTLNGDASTAGSVANAVATAQTTLQGNIDALANMTATSSALIQAVNDNTSNIAGIGAAIEWGTFA